MRSTNIVPPTAGQKNPSHPTAVSAGGEASRGANEVPHRGASINDVAARQASKRTHNGNNHNHHRLGYLEFAIFFAH